MPERLDGSSGSMAKKNQTNCCPHGQSAEGAPVFSFKFLESTVRSGKTTGQQDNRNLFREVFLNSFCMFLFVRPLVRQFEHDVRYCIYMQSPVQALRPGKKPTEGTAQLVQRGKLRIRKTLHPTEFNSKVTV